MRAAMATVEIAPDQKSPAGRRIFHGWYLVGAALISGAFMTGAGTWAFSLFVRPMTEELGWSRSAFFGALTVRSIVSGIIAPFIGPVQDSLRGPRRLMFITVFGMTIGMSAMYWVNSLIMFYLLFGIVGTLMTVGGADMLINAVLPKWFVRKRATALTIASAGQGAGPLLFPVIVSAVIDGWGWRTAWVGVGGAAFILLFPLAFAVRTRPEDVGLHPDGDTDQVTAAIVRHTARERSFTRSEAMREPSMWLINLSTALFVMGVTGLQTNWLLYFQDIGFASTTAALSASAFGIGSFTSRFLWGLLAYRYHVRLLMAVATSLTALTVLLLFQIDGVWMMMGVALLNGLMLGGNFVMRPLIVANYFGRDHLGAIGGVMRPLQIAGSATGPLAVAGLFEATGDWHVAFGLVIAVWAVSALSIAIAVPPKRQPAELAV
jgi:sugar phosphate permease